ncbi:DUF2231 domain-containing protein [Candidatus Viridilinea mediisalina]|uniref:DUF2231 domain-containing protein n=1 Tax=Candidatus Viridilinea mediisalina TaxID=2024553 RepID=A0A2A6REY6_9CHLR|nr:DUF2231 domain-containing protein [Candidatus Viridilinea mediisalina]PDW01445.1 hypothetical protein CJ255_19090 [Candidatus Viridilinea mediisalina]
MPTLHPFTVHFPLALLLVSSLFALLALRTGRNAWATSAYHCLLVGCLSGIVALLTGVADATRQVAGPDAIYGNDIMRLLNAHAFTSIAALACYTAALVRQHRQPTIIADRLARRGYVGLHALGALLLLLSAWLGGRLVYSVGLGIGV